MYCNNYPFLAPQSSLCKNSFDPLNKEIIVVHEIYLVSHDADLSDE
jgi:hypothetical protein